MRAKDVTWYAVTSEYQNPGLGGFVSNNYNGQHWNSEFPWKTGGLDRSPNAKTYKFYAGLDQSKIRRWRETGRFFSNEQPNGYLKWQLPVGTIIGEVIEVDGRTTEVGLISFTGASEPVFSRFAPFAKRDEISKHIVAERVRLARLRDKHGGVAVVCDETCLIHEIELTSSGVSEILSRPFRNVIDESFSEKDGVKCFSPTSMNSGGVVPLNSDRGFFNAKTCLACHKTAGAEGRLLDSDPSPDKYGAVRGGSFVFSLPTNLVK